MATFGYREWGPASSLREPFCPGVSDCASNHHETSFIKLPVVKGLVWNLWFPVNVPFNQCIDVEPSLAGLFNNIVLGHESRGFRMHTAFSQLRNCKSFLWQRNQANGCVWKWGVSHFHGFPDREMITNQWNGSTSLAWNIQYPSCIPLPGAILTVPCRAFCPYQV